MDLTRFTDFKTGKLLRATLAGSEDWTFIPNPLPAAYTISARLWPVLSRAIQRVERLNGVGNPLPNASLLLRPLQCREALTSNSLEGTFVTPEELLLFEADRPHPRKGRSSRENDWIEVFNYDLALRQGCRKIRDGHELNLRLMCDLHGMLLAGVRGDDKGRGQFREGQVWVGVERRYVPPPPEELEGLLRNFEEYMKATDDLDPLVRAYVAHYQLEAIHPFKDGNGRIGRIMLSLMTYKWLELSQPWLYMSEFFEKNRKEYIDRLFRVSTNGEWEEWLEFCLKGTIEQAESSINRCVALQKLKAGYDQKLERESGLVRKVLESVFAEPFVKITDVEKNFNVGYHTAQRCIDRLVKAGVLTEMEKKKRPRTFGALEVFRTAYRD